MNNKQNHTGPNYVTYIPNITNHIINIHITNTILKAFPGVLGLRQTSRPSPPLTIQHHYSIAI